MAKEVNSATEQSKPAWQVFADKVFELLIVLASTSPWVIGLMYAAQCATEMVRYSRMDSADAKTVEPQSVTAFLSALSPSTWLNIILSVLVGVLLAWIFRVIRQDKARVEQAGERESAAMDAVYSSQGAKRKTSDELISNMKELDEAGAAKLEESFKKEAKDPDEVVKKRKNKKKK